MTTIQITEFTDPVCPFAWSAEPSRRRIEWLYGEQIGLRPRMVGLHETGEAMAQKGITTEGLARGSAQLAAAHHMPIDTRERPRLAGSVPACRAVVAVRLRAPQRERAMLRALRIANFAGELVDEIATLRRAAGRAGVDGDDLERWLAEPATEAALREDMRAARAPSPEAVALPGKLAREPHSESGYRYTCPSWELVHDGRTATVPGFQPTAAYEVTIANLAPELTRREDPADVVEVLRWAGEPLASAEVAAVCGLELDDAREQLGRVAREEHLGADGLWSLTEDLR
ncbi:MAG TPA: DsbA family protein [Solirubrobacteraceae bacterium]|nr:DsbA family protein [Solirubrobacteraceae bacterium]